MIVSIVAVDRNFAIGKGNVMPWHLPADFAHFKEITMGNPVIVGYNTFLSIGRPLPGRTNIVLTDKEDIEGCVVAHSLEEAFAKGRAESDTVFVIGGASVYAQALPFCDRVVITYVDTKVSGADTFFPRLDDRKWREVGREKRGADEKNVYDMDFVTYERV